MMDFSGLSYLFLSSYTLYSNPLVHLELNWDSDQYPVADRKNNVILICFYFFFFQIMIEFDVIREQLNSLLLKN